MSPGLPSTLSRILKPLLWAWVISPASAAAPGAQRSCRLTHTIPAVFILSGAEKSLTWPPSCQAPLPNGGGGGGGGGGAVGAGGGSPEPPPEPGITSTWPTKIMVELRPLADMRSATLTPNRCEMAHKVSPPCTV